MLRLKPVLIAVCALSAAGCGHSKKTFVTSDSARGVVGTSLVGAQGATQADQGKIDETAAGLCATGTWTREECSRHGRQSRAPRKITPPAVVPQQQQPTSSRKGWLERMVLR